MNGFQKLIGIMLLSTLLDACGQAPVQQDQPIYLQPGQGVAAVMFQTTDDLDYMTLKNPVSGNKLQINSVPTGTHIYLFVVPAGQYCYVAFSYHQVNFTAEDPTSLCFEVTAGGLAYGGTYAPRGAGMSVIMHQGMQVDQFRTELANEYPIVAKQFLSSSQPQAPLSTAPMTGTPVTATASGPAPALATLMPATPPPLGKNQVDVWAEEVTGTRDQVVFFRNNTGWPMQITNFELYDCIAIKQHCGLQSLKLVLPAHATQAAIVIEPAQPNDAYSYNTRYYYGFVQDAGVPATGFSPPPPQGVVQFWFQDDPTTHARTVMVRNNTAKAVYLHKFELYDCHGVKQACGIQKLKLQLAPYTSQAALVVDPVDPGGFSFKVRFAYGYVGSGKS